MLQTDRNSDFGTIYPTSVQFSLLSNIEKSIENCMPFSTRKKKLSSRGWDKAMLSWIYV